MKKIFFVLTVATIAWMGCGKVEPNRAKALVVSLIHTIDSGKYDKTSAYYTDEFNSGESLKARIQKYKDLKEAFGAVESIQCVSEKDSTDMFDRPIIYLVYKVNHTKLTSIEVYSVVSQNGDYKVEQQDIRKE
jgi:hypothetical protein